VALAPRVRKEHGEYFTSLTAKYEGKHSFSLVDVTPGTLPLRQIAIGGEEVDRITLTKK
jgi:hypothetical protein